MGVVRWRFVLTWLVIAGFLPALVAALRWDWRVALAGLAAIVFLAVLDYRAYAARTNAFAVWAWAVTCYLRATRVPLAQLAVDTRPFRALAAGSKRYLPPEDIPPREGERPEMVYGLPHRQLNQHPDPQMRERFKQRLADQRDFKDLGRREIKFTPSIWELTGAEALIVQGCTAATCSCALNRAKGEFAHLHSHDGSMHMMLAPADVVTVIEKRWGDLFAVSGGLWGRVPQVVLVYAPRTGEEEEIVSRVLRASYNFATAAHPEAA